MMQDCVLSSRRPPANLDEEESEGAGGEDEFKTTKRAAVASISTHLSSMLPPPLRLASASSVTHRCHCVSVSIFVALVIVGAFVYNAARSRPLICVPGYDSLSRTAFSSATLDGFASDIGSLGVPRCRSKHAKAVEWTTKDLLKGLEEFVPIYETRPIKHNMYGMGFDHSFGLWFIVRWLKPELMIESGAFKGHSTWVLRQAMPETRIISLSPRHPEKYLKKGPAYVDNNCTYFTGKDFVDFGSVDWKNVMESHAISDLSRVIVFFDDHQNEKKRLKQALDAGFQHLVFEDNYDTGTGDHYSLRQICDQYYIRGGGHSCFKDSDEARIRANRKLNWEKAVEVEELCGQGEAWWGVRGYMRDNFNHSNKEISYKEHFQNSRFLESILDVYWELPPVAGSSLTHQTRYDPARASDPIVEDGRVGLFQKLGLSKLEASVFNGYTQMVYVQISTSPSNF